MDGTGAFLTSFDVYFAAKDETAKLTVQLATVELGIPTINLVQDFTEVVLNTSDINISSDASVPTTIRFPSPVFLPPDEEYALIFLCPQSDKYEMWVSTMGQKSIRQLNYLMFRMLLYLSNISVVVCLNHRMVQFGHQAKTKI